MWPGKLAPSSNSNSFLPLRSIDSAVTQPVLCASRRMAAPNCSSTRIPAIFNGTPFVSARLKPSSIRCLLSMTWSRCVASNNGMKWNMSVAQDCQWSNGSTESALSCKSSFTTTSRRLTESEATDSTFDSSPASMCRSIPRRQALAAATQCSRTNSKVTLTGTPSKIDCPMAGTPSAVPAILAQKFGRAAGACGRAAAWMVPVVSFASSGEASSDTRPLPTPLPSRIGRNRSAACVRSCCARSKKMSSKGKPRAASL